MKGSYFTLRDMIYLTISFLSSSLKINRWPEASQSLLLSPFIKNFVYIRSQSSCGTMGWTLAYRLKWRSPETSWPSASPFQRFLQRFIHREISNTSGSPVAPLSYLIANFLLGWALQSMGSYGMFYLEIFCSALDC